MKKPIQMCVIDDRALAKVMASKLPQTQKDIFPAFLWLAHQSNANHASQILTWHDTDVDSEAFIPYMEIGVMQLSEYKKRQKEADRKMKKNPARNFHFKTASKRSTNE